MDSHRLEPILFDMHPPAMILSATSVLIIDLFRHSLDVIEHTPA